MKKKNSPGGGGEGYSCFPGGVQSLFLRIFFIKLNWVFKGDPTPIRAWNNLHGNYLIYMVRSLLLTLNQNTLQHQTCGLWCTRHRRHRAKSLKVTGSGRDQKDVNQKVRTQLWINKKKKDRIHNKNKPRSLRVWESLTHLKFLFIRHCMNSYTRDVKILNGCLPVEELVHCWMFNWRKKSTFPK